MLAIAAPLLNACSGGPNEAAEYRHSIFHVIAWHFGTLGAMAKGEQPFDQAVFERKAGILENLSKLPWEGFQEGTAEGSDAKPAIWENWSKFESAVQDFERESAKLAKVAESGDMEALAKQVRATGKTCGGCHRNFRKRD